MRQEDTSKIKNWKNYLVENTRISLLTQYIGAISMMTWVIIVAVIWMPQYIAVISIFSIASFIFWLYVLQRLRYFQRVQLPLALDHLHSIDTSTETTGE